MARTEPENTIVTVTRKSGEELSYDPRRLQGVTVYRDTERTFAEGDRVHVTAPYHEQKLANRELGTVEQIDGGGNLKLKMDSGRQVEFNARQHPHLDYGYLALSDAPFDKEDPTLNPAAGACITCPRRSGFNTSLFSDVTNGDHCLDGNCYQIKMNNYIDREIAARPELVQIENGYRSPKEKRPGAVQRGHFREIEHTDNPDAEPVAPCEAAKTAIIVYGKRVGSTFTVCTDNTCPVHDPRAAARRAKNPEPVMPPAPPAETDEEAEARRQQHQQQRKEYEEEQECRAEQHRQQQERQKQEYEAAQARREEQRKARTATFERILENAPETLNAAQLRVLLRAIVNLDPYTFADDLAEDIADENEPRSTEEVLLATIDATADEKLIRFAIRLALSGHVGIPREGELDFLSEAEAAFTAPAPKQAKTPKKQKQPTPIKPDSPTTKPKKSSAAKKKIAA